MSTRAITRDQAAAWGLPDDLADPADDPKHPSLAVELARIEDTGRRRWASENDLVFRAPDDGRTYRVTYFQGLTETQEDHDVWNDEREIKLTEVKPVNVFTVEWHRAGGKTPPATPDGDTKATPAPTGDQFTEAAIRRGAYLDAANALADPGPSVCDCERCAACALHQASQQLRRLADHYTTAEQPAGLTWEARADHAIRLYARTAIELEDTKAVAARLRAERAELIRQRDRIADDTIKALITKEQHPAVAATAQAYRAAADEINALPQDYETDPGRGNAAEYLRRRATELETAEQPPADEYRYCGATVDEGEKGYHCARPDGHKGPHAPIAPDLAPE